MTSGNHRASARQAASELKGRVRGLVLDALSEATGRRATAIDRDFFAEHPSKSTYVRAVLPGEFQDATPWDWAVAVRRSGDASFDRAYFPTPSDLTEPAARLLALLIDAVFERVSESRGAPRRGSA